MGAPRPRRACPGHSRRAPEEAGGACGEPDKPLSAPRAARAERGGRTTLGAGRRAGEDRGDPAQTREALAGSRAYQAGGRGATILVTREGRAGSASSAR